MTKPTLLLLALLTIVAVGAAYVRYGIGPRVNQQLAQYQQQLADEATPSASMKPGASTRQPSEDEIAILKSLSARQKIAQLLAFPVVVSNSEMVVATGSAGWVADQNPGFVTLFGEGISTSSAQEATSTLLAKTEATTQSGRTVIRTLFAVDHEGKPVQRLAGKGFTKLPSWRTSCGQTDAELRTQLASSAAELRRAGVDLVFGPVVDTVATSSSFLAQRSCAATFSAVLAPTKTWVDTFNQAGIGSVMKHYPNLGGLLSDPHNTFESVATASAAEKWFVEQYANLPVAGAMTSHAGQPPEEDTPCSQSVRCMKPLTTIPEKLLFSDALEMSSALHGADGKQRSTLEVAIDAFVAGNDVIVYGPQQNAFFTKLLDGLEFQYGTQPEFKKIVDDRLIKVLRFKKSRQKNWILQPITTPASPQEAP